MDISEQAAAIARFRRRFETFGEVCLRLLPKAGGKPVPMIMNRAQRHVHEVLETQLRETGKVRALILKGRQQGISTYVAARFYKRASTEFGRQVFVVAHEAAATSNLFKMAKRYHEHNPLAPSTAASNAKELIFDKLDSGYSLATAGTKDAGRSKTAHLLHASEFAFWSNAATHLAGLGNIVPPGDGSEIIIESTGNGIGNPFHELWQQAEAGEGEYIAIFVPWMWQDEYRAPVPDGFVLTPEEAEYARIYGCDMQQMAWRRLKIASYPSGFGWLFDQEFPAAPALAFQSPTAAPIISPLLVSRAQASTYRDKYGPLIIGVDPSEGVGRDRTAIVFRRGRLVPRVEAHDRMSLMQCAGLIAQYYREHKPDAIFIDRGAGAGIIDRLRELQIPCVGVGFGEAATDPDLYVNKRVEMWWALREWLEDEPCRLPKDAELAADLSAPGFPRGQMLNSQGRRQLESKEDMAKRGIRSPDLGDALALTFAYPVEMKSEGAHYNSVQAEAPTAAGY